MVGQRGARRGSDATVRTATRLLFTIAGNSTSTLDLQAAVMP
jgi:hypothetical protein